MEISDALARARPPEAQHLRCVVASQRDRQSLVRPPNGPSNDREQENHPRHHGGRHETRFVGSPIPAARSRIVGGGVLKRPDLINVVVSDLLPCMPSFISRIRWCFAPLWGGLQTRLA